MKFAVLASPRAPHQLAHQSALAEGLAACGVQAEVSAGAVPAGATHVACWGWHHGRALRAAGFEVLVMERGYVGDRFAWTSLGWNGLNGRAQFPVVCPTHELPEIAQWRTGGAYVLLLGQVPGDASLQGKDLSYWYAQAAGEARKAYGLPVHFRPHPLSARRGGAKAVAGTEPSTGSLDEALAGAAVAITWNSNSAVDAVLAGVPTVAMDEGSMAWEVTAHRIGDTVKPERAEWLQRLVDCQWALDEIRSGVAVKALLEIANGDYVRA